MSRILVVGATSWGVTLAALLAERGHEVTVAVRHTVEADALRSRRELERLPGVSLPASVNVEATDSLTGAFDGVVVATPAQAVRHALVGLPNWPRPAVLSVAKGLEAGTNERMSEVIAARWPGAIISVLSGPNLSHEIAKGAPAAAVVASADPGAAQFWQRAVSAGTFRAYTSGDVIGVELAGALKNVVAIAAGVAWGLGFGANTVAAIMTRGLAEISRLGIALGAEASTFQGLAGIGDLSATCFSPLSRNRQLGELLATGYSITEAQRSIGQAVEGRATAPVAVVLARRAHVEMPIAEHVTALLEGSESVIEAMGALLERPLTAEGQ